MFFRKNKITEKEAGTLLVVLTFKTVEEQWKALFHGLKQPVKLKSESFRAIPEDAWNNFDEDAAKFELGVASVALNLVPIAMLVEERKNRLFTYVIESFPKESWAYVAESFQEYHQRYGEDMQTSANGAPIRLVTVTGALYGRWGLSKGEYKMGQSFFAPLHAEMVLGTTLSQMQQWNEIERNFEIIE